MKFEFLLICKRISGFKRASSENFPVESHQVPIDRLDLKRRPNEKSEQRLVRKFAQNATMDLSIFNHPSDGRLKAHSSPFFPKRTPFIRLSEEEFLCKLCSFPSSFPIHLIYFPALRFELFICLSLPFKHLAVRPFLIRTTFQ